MTSSIDKNNRIAKNTLLLYVRMLFFMLVHLYTSRVVLQALGIENYGVYNAVAGFIALFCFASVQYEEMYLNKKNDFKYIWK